MSLTFFNFDLILDTGYVTQCKNYNCSLKASHTPLSRADLGLKFQSQSASK